MGLIEDYFEITTKLKQSHGERSVVLIQNGAFYEIYGLKDEVNNRLIGSNISDICNYCDLNIANKKMMIRNMDVVQAGFGIKEHIVDKYMKKMLDYGYVVSIWEQDEKACGTSRRETGIYSSGTYFSNDTKEITNNLLCIWICKYKQNIIIGTSNIDVYTGKSSIYEYSTQYSKSPNTYHDLERLISIYNPSETIIIHNLGDKEVKDIVQYMSFRTDSIRIFNKDSNISTNEIKQIENCEKQIYQKEILRNFFNENVIQLESEFMMYEIATCSYCYLLNFVLIHNPNLIKKIALPVFDNNGSKLQLGNHSLKQLNIIDTGVSSGKVSSVERFLNKCITAPGRRRFTRTLVSPKTDENMLNKEYCMMEYCLSKQEPQKMFGEKLTYIKDLEKLNRKMILRKITPRDFVIIHSNLLDIQSLYSYISTDEILDTYFNKPNLISQCQQIENHISSVLDLSLCSQYNSHNDFDNNFIRRGINVYHDKTVEKMVDSYDKLECISEYLNTELMKSEKSKNKCVKVYQTDKNGYSITLTKRRATILKTHISKRKTPVCLSYFSKYTHSDQSFSFDCKSIQFVDSTKSDAYVTSIEIKELCNLIQQSKHAMLKSLQQVYNTFIDEMIEFSDNVENISDFVSKCDVLYSKLYTANKYNYCKPVIHTEATNSFMNVEGIRHPLIEHILQDELYISNDVDLDNDQTGILLYGTNAVGKSSFIKSLGICIIMAQAGMFVPCNSLIFKPYKNIFTRILGNDNLFKGLSTFAVEMLELKSIIKGCDENTLILGDELCSGTETDSAISIFIAGLNHMYNKKSNFIFATHFHEIVDYDEIRLKEKMVIKHMEVIYNKECDSLIYDRKLLDGPGNNMYGLEVCKSLHLPDDFLNEAYSIRNKYSNKMTNILELKQSHFNSRKIMGLCELCEQNMSSEVHHLQHQKEADSRGFIGEFHKNHVANLFSVCESCHNKLHQDKEVKGHTRIKTSSGMIIEKL